MQLLPSLKEGAADPWLTLIAKHGMLCAILTVVYKNYGKVFNRSVSSLLVGLLVLFATML